jgi:hypothetical protein
MAPEFRSSTQIRTTLQKLLAAHRCSSTEVSRLIGRHPDYVGRFLRGRPERLPPIDAQMIARYFGVNEGELGVIAEYPGVA